MSRIILGKVSFIDNPEKEFWVCDKSSGNDFLDPLLLFNEPDYDTHNVNHKGLYAVGGELDLDSVIKSYKWGIFPWFAFKHEDEINWYCPRERFVIFPEKVHMGHTLRNMLNKGKYNITINKNFSQVIDNCRKINGRDKSEFAWLSETIVNIFNRLNEIGLAKSVELWEDDKLVGGFYGFWYNGVFQGESMFSLSPSASQIALVLFCRLNNIEGEKIKFIDTQFENPIFKRLGGEYISYSEFREFMDKK